MVKVNNIISLLAVASFSLVSAKPFKSRFSNDYCKDLDAFLNTKKATLDSCDVSSDFSYVIIKSDSITQDIIDKINTYDGILDTVDFENVSSIQKGLNLKNLKSHSLEFDNKHYNGKMKEIYIPKNVLKTAKTVSTISITGLDLTQRNLNEITTLTQLKELYLDSLTVEANMDYSNLKKLKNLTSLVLSTFFQKGQGEDIKYLGKVPESVCQLKKLNYLSLYRNGITSVPKCIANLKNLERLDLRINDIESIPRAVRKMPNLEILLEY